MRYEQKLIPDGPHKGRAYGRFSPGSNVKVRSFVVLFHGAFDNIGPIVARTKIHEHKAFSRCVILVPRGEEKLPGKCVWNTGMTVGDAVKATLDDLDFIGTMLEQEGFSATLHRLYTAGFSQGGCAAFDFSRNVTVNNTTVIARACASVAFVPDFDARTADRRVPLYLALSTVDEFAHFDGGRAGFINYEHRSALPWIQERWGTTVAIDVPGITRNGDDVVRIYDDREHLKVWQADTTAGLAAHFQRHGL